MTIEELAIILEVFEQGTGEKHPDLHAKLRVAYETMSDEYRMAVAE